MDRSIDIVLDNRSEIGFQITSGLVQWKGYESHSREDRVTVGFRVTTKVGCGWLNISSRTREKSPSHDMTIIQSVSYRDRSLSRGRTHMDLEDPNGVSEWDIGLPTQHPES